MKPFSRVVSTILSTLKIEGFDVKALRAFRVLRPLRLVSGVPSKTSSLIFFFFRRTKKIIETEESRKEISESRKNWHFQKQEGNWIEETANQPLFSSYLLASLGISISFLNSGAFRGHKTKLSGWLDRMLENTPPFTPVFHRSELWATQCPVTLRRRMKTLLLSETTTCLFGVVDLRSPNEMSASSSRFRPLISLSLSHFYCSGTLSPISSHLRRRGTTHLPFYSALR